MSTKKKPVTSPAIPPTESGLSDVLWQIHFRLDFLSLLKQYSWMPLADHKNFAESLYERVFRKEYNAPLSPAVLRCHLAYLECHRTMLGRAVQPHRKLSNLAPVIGAIRLEAPGALLAGGYLAPLIIQATKAGDSEFLSHFRKYCQADLASHRNCQIWVAIFEILANENFAPSKMLSVAVAPSGAKIQLRLFPNTKEVKDYVFSLTNNGADRFNDLPSDDSTFSKLLKSSGAKRFVEKAGRGPGVIP